MNRNLPEDLVSRVGCGDEVGQPDFEGHGLRQVEGPGDQGMDFPDPADSFPPEHHLAGSPGMQERFGTGGNRQRYPEIPRQMLQHALHREEAGIDRLGSPTAGPELSICERSEDQRLVERRRPVAREGTSEQAFARLSAGKVDPSGFEDPDRIDPSSQVP